MKNTKFLNILLPFVSLGLIYATMLIGVYISSLNRGVTCTDWPLCPNGFAFPPEKFFYEHFHRLVAIIAAIFTGISLIFIRKSLWKLNKLIVIIVTSLIIVQIVMGIFVVSSKLNPVIVAVHLSTAVTIFSLIFVLLRESYLEIKKGRV
ncbi:MAG TPA: COX15/CtaA family protein [Nitrososphaeraceae archaeon]|nr:COX15/CtaA family protein [Nitrososphaeraceae archaeon]